MGYNLTTRSYMVFGNNTNISNEEIISMAKDAISIAKRLIWFVDTRKRRFFEDSEFCNKVCKNVKNKLRGEIERIRDVQAINDVLNPVNEIYQYLFELDRIFYKISFENYNGTARLEDIDNIKKHCEWVIRDAGSYADPRWKGCDWQWRIDSNGEKVWF